MLHLGRHKVVVEAELALLLGEKPHVGHGLLHGREVGPRAHRFVLKTSGIDRNGGFVVCRIMLLK